MDRPTPPPFIALRPIHSDLGETVNTTGPTDIKSPATTPAGNPFNTLKPLADRFWYIPWLILGVVTWKWVKEKLP